MNAPVSKRAFWWSGFYAGMGVQFAILVFLFKPTPHHHPRHSPWPLVFWFGASVVAGLAAAGYRLSVSRRKRWQA